MGKVFLKRGSVYSVTEGNFDVSPMLDDGIYQIVQEPNTGELFLVRIADEFYFGFKLYGVDETLVKHVLDTYNKQPTKKNLGVLLNGAKGTGKTVTAKVIANKLGLPVILCDKPYPNLSRFLAGINHDCVFFFDEFEKNFRLKFDDDEECAGEDLLSIMDGVYNSDNCHIFILTTNDLRINDNLISRPSRIRYLKSFGSVIEKDILEEFIDDNLIYKQYKDEIMELVDGLTMSTIDVVKSIVEEVNLHNCSVNNFKRFFNIKEALYVYSVRSWSFEKAIPDYSKEEFIKASKNASKDSSFIPHTNYLKLKKDIKKIKIGDLISSRYRVAEIDLDNNYILCDDVICPYMQSHYYVYNSDEKPTLYANNNNCAYENSEYDW
jgi:hypothetical protein